MLIIPVLWRRLYGRIHLAKIINFVTVLCVKRVKDFFKVLL